MAKKVKCQVCEQRDNQNLMIQEENKKYYHKEKCYDIYLKQKAFKERERKEKDELIKEIMKIHNISSSKLIPKIFFMKIEEIRNDSDLLTRKNMASKKGIKYSGILYTYRYCSEKIKKALHDKADQPLLNQMNYCLGIVKSNIVDAARHFKKMQKQKHDTEKLINDVESLSKVTEKIKSVQHRPIIEDDEEIDLTTIMD